MELIELSESSLERLADLVVTKLKRSLPAKGTASRSDVPRRMSVAEFAACVNLCHEVVRRRIRSQFIAPEHVEGRAGGSYYVDRAALAKFNVTLDVASERLEAWRHRAEASGTAGSPERAHAQSAA